MNPRRINKTMTPASLQKSVCIDLDATLSRYTKWEGEEIIGKPLEGAEQFVKALKNRGFRIIILTSRCWPASLGGRVLNVAVSKHRVQQWLEKHGIPFDEIHGKPLAVAYVSDLAVAVKRNPPPGDFARALAEIEQLTWVER